MKVEGRRKKEEEIMYVPYAFESVADRRPLTRSSKDAGPKTFIIVFELILTKRDGKIES